MNTGNPNDSGNAYLDQWMETTRRYLLAETRSLTDEAGKALPEPGLESHGAQDRYISRARGSLLRLLKRAPQRDRNPLKELERAFHLQVLFISRHPEVPRRLLGWVSQDGDSRIRRRIQMVIAHYESRLCRMIALAKHQGRIRSDIDPHAAAVIVIGMIQSLALRMNINLRQRELLVREAFESFALFRTGMISASR